MRVIAALLAALASAIGAGQPAGLPPGLPSTLPGERADLATDLDLAQQIIDDPTSQSSDIANAGRFQQLATVALARKPAAAQRAALAGLAPAAAAAMRADLDAATALARLAAPRKSLPPWRILAPSPPATLLAHFKAAQARFGVPWEYMAAIEFVETGFGRVRGLSIAGAEGPMQFLPATWARYGKGDVNNPRDAIFGAARYLVANGAPRDMPRALYHYNPSTYYVRAITDYALRMRTDDRAYDGYYWWHVIYVRRGRTLILPVGFPKARPMLVSQKSARPRRPRLARSGR